MLSALAIAAALSVSAPQGVDAAQRLRDACVTTGMRREAFERLARERHWQRARTTSASGRQGSWNLVMRGDGATVMLSYEPDFGADASIGSVCSVSVEHAAPGLEREVAGLAASLGLSDEPSMAEQPEGMAPMRVWSRVGDSTLTYAATPDGRAVLSLSRQIVTHETAPVSPSGN